MDQSNSNPNSFPVAKTHYKVFHGDSLVCGHESLQMLIENIYLLLANYSFHNIISSLKVNCYYGVMSMTSFAVRFDHGLQLTNADNQIKVSALFPIFIIYDLELSKKIRPIYQPPDRINSEYRDDTLSQKRDQSDLAPMMTKSVNVQVQSIPNRVGNDGAQGTLVTPQTVLLQKNCHRAYEKKSLVAKKSQMRNKKIPKPIEKTDDEKLAEIDELKEADREDRRRARLKELRQIENKKIFAYDKKIYSKVKTDIEDGLITPETLNPTFKAKYYLLKLLESRSLIDFTSDSDIDAEYLIFEDLFTTCEKTESESKSKSKLDPVVYVPHNYRFLSTEDKIKCAKKYDLTVDEFEATYVNVKRPETIFDLPKPIKSCNNIPLDSDTEHDTESDTNSDTDSDSDSQSDHPVPEYLKF